MKEVNYLLVGGAFDGEIHPLSPKTTGETIVIVEVNDYTKKKLTEFYVVSDYLIPELPQHKVATLEGIPEQEIKRAIKKALGF